MPSQTCAETQDVGRCGEKAMISAGSTRAAKVAAMVCGALIISVATAACACDAGKLGARPWLDTTLTPEARADALVAQLDTVERKLEALGAGGLKCYGLIEPQGSDGPAGPTQTPGAVSLPDGLALAAAFSPELASDYGAVVGRQFRASGRQRMLGPTLDIARTWRAGRVPEAYGEDPFLSGRVAAAFVKAAQSEGVAVTLKHFAVYTQEQGRTGDMPFGLKPAVDNVVTERVIREIYLPAFRAAVQDGGALNVMCAFPRVNGVYACENPFLLSVLKREWRMRGTVSPDFPDAQRSVIEAVNAGLDNGSFGFPGGLGPPPPSTGTPSNGPPAGGGLGAALGLGRIPGGIDLGAAVRQGKVSQARLDDMLRRRLVSMFAVGAGTEPARPHGEFDDTAAQALALRVAEAGAVLLRNQGDLLPLGRSVRSIAVIGAQAGPRAQVSTPGSAHVEPSRLVSAIEAIRARAGDVKVTYAQGSAGIDALPVVPPEVLRNPEGAPGLSAAYYANPNLRFEGTPFAERTEAGVNLSGPLQIATAPSNNGWSAVWSGQLRPRRSGLHKFTIAGSGSGRLLLDGAVVARFDRVDFGTVAYATASLVAGRPVKLRIEYTPRESAPLPGMPLLGTTLGTLMRFGWEEPDGKMDAAVEAARRADVAVVFVADRYGEGADRTTLRLPGDQDELIEAVAAANPHTVVVLSTAGPVTMPWAGRVSGIIEMWYSGDVFGRAASRILFGDAAPQGRLPISFPRDQAQGPGAATRNYPGLTGPDGAIEAAHFDEGLQVGYRWFDAHGQAPLFPFGFGLGYAPIRIERAVVAAKRGLVRVSAVLHNTGARPGSEVAQVYVGFPQGAGEPPKRLAGFQRVDLAAGQRRRIEITLPASAFELWDEAGGRWRTPPGRYLIMIGRSSRNISFRRSLKR